MIKTLLLADTRVSQSVSVHAPSTTPDTSGQHAISRLCYTHSTSGESEGMRRGASCGAPTLIGGAWHETTGIQSVSVHAPGATPTTYGLACHCKAMRQVLHQWGPESEGMGRGVPSGALTLVGGAWHLATSTLCDGVSKRLMRRDLASTPGIHKLQRLGAYPGHSHNSRF